VETPPRQSQMNGTLSFINSAAVRIQEREFTDKFTRFVYSGMSRRAQPDYPFYCTHPLDPLCYTPRNTMMFLRNSPAVRNRCSNRCFVPIIISLLLVAVITVSNTYNSFSILPTRRDKARPATSSGPTGCRTRTRPTTPTTPARSSTSTTIA
jgi:hypothetical protein